MSGKLFFGVSLAERARAEEKNHRGTEGTEKGCDLCVLCVLCVSVSLCLCGSTVFTKPWFS